MFSFSLARNFRDFYWILIGWFIELSVQTFQQLIVIYRKGNFVYYRWGCTSINIGHWPFKIFLSRGKEMLRFQDYNLLLKESPYKVQGRIMKYDTKRSPKFCFSYIKSRMFLFGQICFHASWKLWLAPEGHCAYGILSLWGVLSLYLT